MEIKKVTPEMREALRKPLDAKAITKHPTKTYLSSIKNIYIVERLNDVFGVGSWSQKSKVISDNKGMVVVHSELTIPEYGIQLESFGGNDNGGEGSKNFDLGDAYKGACTDALSKICSFLEIAIDVFKGNGNVAPPQESSAPPKQPEPLPNNTQQQANNFESGKKEAPKKPDSPVLLSPNDKANPERWDKVVKWLQDKNKTEQDWPELKKSYIISEADERKLFEQLSWLPFL